MFYDSLPSDWQTKLEAKRGADFRVEVVFDPDDRNIMLTGRYDVVEISPISYIRDLDLDFGQKTQFSEIKITFNDPDDYFSPSNEDSPFHNAWAELYEDTATGTAEIKVNIQEGVVFSVGERLLIEGYDHTDGSFNSETITVRAFTSGASWNTITCDGLTNNYKSGTSINTLPIESKIIEIRLKESSCVSHIACFIGRVLKFPNISRGRAILTIVDIKKYYYDQYLIGAEQSSANKIKVHNSSGTLADSVYWEVQTGNAALDRAEIVVLDNCGIGLWTATFEDANNYLLKGPNVNNMSCDIRYGFHSTTTPSGTIITSVSDGSYLYCVGLGDFLIYDLSDTKAPSEEYYGATLLTVTNIAIDVSGDIVCAGFLRLNCIDVTTKSSPSLEDQVNLSASHYIYDLLIVGNYCFCGTYGGNIDVYDISTPSSISLSDSLNIASSTIGGITIDGNYLYATCLDDQTLYVVDISDPTDISLEGSVDLGYDIKDCVHNGSNHVYVTGGTDMGIIVVDVSTPGSPSNVGELSGSGYPNYLANTHGIRGSGNYAYLLNSDESALVIIDCTTKSAPEIFEVILSDDGHFTGFGDTYRNISLQGEYLFLHESGGELVIYRVAPPITARPGGDQVRIPPSAWSNTPAELDQVVFSTGILLDSVNVVQAIYNIETDYAGIDNKYINCSSYFGNKEIGKLWTSYSAGETEIKIRIGIPALIKTGETLTITEGATTEDVTVSTGNSETTQYPPFIELDISALSNSYTHLATVTWKQRGSLDTDFNYDDLYDYCDTNSFDIKLSLEREMTIEQAVETLVQHLFGYVYQDSWGRSTIHAFRNYSSVLGTFSDSTNIKRPLPEIQQKEMTNELKIQYGYNYRQSDEGFQHKKIYPEITNDNPEYLRSGILRRKTVRFPGYWDIDVIDVLGALIYKMWRKGLNIILYDSMLQGLVVRNGDKFTISNNKPSISTDIDITGKTLRIKNGINVELIGYDCKSIFKV